MPKSIPTLMLAALLVAGLTGCDGQRWVSTVKAPVATSSTNAHVWPAFSQSGRVEARVLAQYGPSPKAR